MWETPPDAGPLSAADDAALDLALWRLVDVGLRLDALRARAEALAEACDWRSAAFVEFRGRVLRWGEAVRAASEAVRAAEGDLRSARWRMRAAGIGGG